MRALALALALFAACAACAVTRVPEKRRTPGSSEVVLYLDGPGKTDDDVGVEIAGVVLEDARGGAVTLLERPLEVAALEVTGRQLRLGTAEVPPGEYRAIRIETGRAWVREKGRTRPLRVPEGQLRREVRLDVEPGEVATLFLRFQPRALAYEGAIDAAVFEVEASTPRIRGLLLYVACEGADEVTLVDREARRVVGAIRAPPRPRGIVASPDGTKVYVASAGASEVAVIDSNAGRITGRARLPAGMFAERLALSPDGARLFATVPRANAILEIDARTLEVGRSIPTGDSPAAVAVDATGRTLYVANAGAASVTRVDLDRRDVTATIPVGPEPVDLGFSISGDELYVACSRSNDVFAIPVPERSVGRQLPVGPGALSIQADTVLERLFVLKRHLERVVLYDLKAVTEIQSVAVGLVPALLAFDPDRRKLFVSNEGSATVSVVDAASGRVEATIPVGARPFGLALTR